jgi:hypothetical protein
VSAIRSSLIGGSAFLNEAGKLCPDRPAQAVMLA